MFTPSQVGGAPPPPGQPNVFKPGGPCPPGGGAPPGAPAGPPGGGGGGFYQGGGAPGVVGGATPSLTSDHIDYNIKLPNAIFRLTMGTLPQSATQSPKLPLGGLLRPLAPLSEEEQIATVQPGTAGIVRCKRCRTYMNAFVSWSEHGRRWQCNICGQINDCPSAYYSHLDNQGLRQDRHDRPELSQAVIEYLAPAEYMVRPPQEPSYFFVIDVSAAAVRSGVLRSVSRAIATVLDDLPGQPRTKIGFVTFDCSGVHYVNLASDLRAPQLLVVSDLKQLFVPLPDSLLVNLQESRSLVDTFLEGLPDMYAKNAQVDISMSPSCLGSALKAAFTVLKDIGGKMLLFQSVLPTIGDGSLKFREQPNLMGTPNETNVLKAQIGWYKDTAIEFSRQQISVDVFLFPSSYMDLATLGDLAKYSSGSLFSYVGFTPENDGERLEAQVRKTLMQETAFEAVMRIRCTKGMKITNFYGNFTIRGQDLLSLPSCQSDSVFGFELAHEDAVLTSNHVTIQAALLYTSSHGERRIRVMTQALPVSTRTSEVIQSIDAEAAVALVVRQAIDVSVKPPAQPQTSSLDHARLMLQQMCVTVLRASRGGDQRTVSGYTVEETDNGDQTIPDHLKLLPLLSLAAMKNVALRGGNDVHPDERIQAHHTISHLFCHETKHFVYPRMFDITKMPTNCGESVSEVADDIPTAGRNRIRLPPVVNLSVERLSSDGVFLLDNGVDMYLWVGRTADMSTVGSLFGMHTLEDMEHSQVRR